MPAHERLPHRESAGVPRSRGWRILREQWRDFLQHQHEVPGRILADMASPERPQRGGMSNEVATRALERIISQITETSPRSAQKLKVWKGAEQMHSEVYTALKKQGWPPPHRSDKRAGQPPHEKVFPTPWLNACTEATVADLVLDAFMSDFADALIDGAVVLTEATRERTATPGGRGCGHSSSAPTLEVPKTRGWSRPSISGASSGAASNGAANIGNNGFTMAGLPEDDWDAWNKRKFHACSNSQTYLQRVAKATDAQRPRRRISCSLGAADQRKYVWPMTATNFPDEWQHVTSPPKAASKSRGGPSSKSSASKAATSKAATSSLPDEESRENRHSRYMTFDRHGRTLFPYSLVSHRAFLESQTDPILKAKAEKLAPLRMTNPW